MKENYELLHFTKVITIDMFSLCGAGGSSSTLLLKKVYFPKSGDNRVFHHDLFWTEKELTKTKLHK